MSYGVHIFSSATHARFLSAKNNRAFFDDSANLAPFSKEQLTDVREQLELAGFEGASKKKSGEVFQNEDWSAEALLTEHGLYLKAPLGSEGVFEIGMFASEIAAGGIVDGLAKFDPQDGTWEVA